MSSAGLSGQKSRAGQKGLLSQPAHILVVDDEAFIREILVRKLRAQGYVCDSCRDAQEALRVLASQPCDLFMADIKTPSMDGINLIKEAQAVCPGIAIVLVTSVVDLDVAVEALKHGAYDYITKPFSLEEVTIGVARALEKRRLILENQSYRRTLEEQVASRTRELKEALEVLHTTYHSTLLALGTALDTREADTGWHSLRVTMGTARLARALGLGESEIRNMEQGALLHDIGKIGVPDALLRKRGKLAEAEWALLRKHPEIGYRILTGVKFLQGAALMVLHHHERFDGTGYPGQLKGENISLGARVFAVAHTLDCLTSDRPFQAATTFEAARDEILRRSGTQFDPAIVDVFERIALEEWKDVRRAVAEQAVASR